MTKARDIMTPSADWIDLDLSILDAAISSAPPNN